MLMRMKANAGGAGPGLANRRSTTSDTGIAGTLDLKPLVRLLRWRARSITAVVLAALVLAAALIALLPAKYTATAVVLLDPRETRVTASESVISGIGSDAAAVESQVEVFQSPVLARRVIEQLKLEEDPQFTASGHIETFATAFGFAQPDTPERRMTRIIDKFSKALRVSRRGLSYILEVNFSAGTPEKAAQIANAVGSAYIAEQQALRSALTQNASSWLDERIDSIRQRLSKSEQAVADYKTSHSVVDVLQGGRLIQRRLEDVSRELATSQLRKAEFGGRLQQIEVARSQKDGTDALAELLQSQTIGALRTRYSDAAGQVARLSSQYGNRHPALIAARAQIGELRTQIDLQLARGIAGLREDYAAATKQQTALEAEMTSLKEQAENQEQVSVQLAALTREAEADRALFNQYLGRLKETNQEQTLRFDNARIISPALPPLKPSGPGSLIVLLAAGLGGLMLGAGGAVFSENVRAGLRTTEDVEESLGIPCLGVVPEARRPSRRRPASDTWNKSSPEYRRCISAIATRLKRSGEQSGEVLVVTSALAGEGKSRFACDLSFASAASGARTLLIDGDDYAGNVTRSLLRAVPIANADDGHPRLTKVPVAGDLCAVGLADISGAGAAIPNQIADLLIKQRKAFDVTIVDTPPIVPTGGGRLPDSADRVVLVAKWNATDRAAIADAIAMLEPHDRKLAGVVLTEASPRWYRFYVQGKYKAAGRAEG
jgi:uncharacterized protein involved in exopolysaccharide biosynthesis/Mrp family chromosome partitioning ATPase